MTQPWIVLLIGCADLIGKDPDTENRAEIHDDVATNDGVETTGPSLDWYTDGDGDGWVEQAGDCDDAEPDTHPDARELCDTIDNDCDGEVDEDVGITWYFDWDHDGYGDATAITFVCEAPPGYIDDGSDCDDTLATTFPGAIEICNGIDEDCDGAIDEGVIPAWYWDADGDQYGDAAFSADACTAPEGYVGNSSDCDDRDSTVRPLALERCNGGDDDCDGAVDEADAIDMTTWYLDADGDRFGDAGSSTAACDLPRGHVADATDCDDNDGRVFPSATELCNDLDDDCDGAIDEDAFDGATWYSDTDGDGYGDVADVARACDVPTYYVADATDCDDQSNAVSPGAAETCNDLDDDCDGEVDEDDATDVTAWYLDGDGDGFSDGGTVAYACHAPAGYVIDASDCDDHSDTVSPGADELCNEVDDDCDGDVDEDDAIDGTAWYLDGDLDTYGDAGNVAYACSAPAGYVADASDCDDDSNAVRPDATESCDALDNDCDGEVDEGVGTTTWYADADGDGFGTVDATVAACTQPAAYVTDATDCDDSDADSYPNATETPADGIDQNCDGLDGCSDLNCDGYPDIVFGNSYEGTTWAPDSYIYWGGASGFSEANRATVPTTAAYDTNVADLDVDGYLDLVFSNLYDGSSWSLDSYIYWGDPAGAYTSASRTDLPTTGSIDNAVADVDLDGYLDLVFSSYWDGSTGSLDSYIYWGSSTGFSSSNRATIPTEGASHMSVADLDLDGLPDIVVSNYPCSGTRRVDSYIYWARDGFDVNGRTPLPTIGAMDNSVADLNADGYPDIIFSNHDDGPAYNGNQNSYIYWGSASGFSVTNRTDLPTRGAWDNTPADLNLDGYLDLVFSNDYAYSHTLDSYIYWGSASGFSVANRTDLPTVGAKGHAVGDLDLDGYPDIVFTSSYNSSTWYLDSYIYWGSASGFSAADRDELPTVGAISVAIAGPGSAWYADTDADGWGDPATAIWAGEAPDVGWIGQAGDCDDTDHDSHPGSPEVSGDGLDNDCDGSGAIGLATVLFSETLTSTIWSMDPDGTGLSIVSQAVDSPHDLAYDAADGTLYVSRWPSEDQIHTMNLDGSSVAALYAGGGDGGQGIAIDPATGLLFWGEYYGGLYQGSMDGSASPTLLASSATLGADGVGMGVEIDPDDGVVYFFTRDNSSSAGRAIWRIDLDGANLTKIRGLESSDCMSMELVERYLYFSDRTGGTFQMWRMSLDDTTDVVPLFDLAENTGCLGVAVDPYAGQIYYHTNPGEPTNEGKLWRSGLDGTSSELLVPVTEGGTAVLLVFAD